ncbi:MAG: hypothetical protein WC229_00640 [Candidatus Paceibacterota bacterium]|jgi:hypothetical protein
MDKTFEQPQNNQEKELAISKLDTIFTEAESIFEKEGREEGKKLLAGVYSGLMTLNKRDVSDWVNQFVWNPEGDLTEEQFKEFDRRRKILSNAIGIMTASGVRYDLNIIE